MMIIRVVLQLGLFSSVAGVGNITSPFTAQCDYPKSKVGSIHTVVYHIYEGGSGFGLAEKNAATAPFDWNFALKAGLIAGTYYQGGYIAKNHVGVTRWGKYLPCNHAAGSHVYKCAGDSGGLAGATSVPVLHDDPKQMAAIAYSFPAVGKDKTWSEYDGKTGPCAMIRIKAKCLFNLWAKAGSCPKGCDGIDNKACTQCVASVPDAKKLDLFIDAIDGGKCHRYESAEEELRDIEKEKMLLSNETVMV